MARVPSLAQTEPYVRRLAAAARLLAFAGRSCANCGSPEIRPSNCRNALDVLLACMFLAPFRCRVCRRRFYRMWRPSLQRSPGPPLGPPLGPPRAPLRPIPTRREVAALRALSPRPSERKPAAVQSVRQTHMVPPARKAEVLALAPVKSADAEPTPSAPFPAVASAPILILESDLSIRKLLRRLLERRGYLAAEISHADQLAGALGHHHYALLVVDVSETGTMSVELIAALAHAHPSLKILVLSGESHAGTGRAGEFPSRLLALPKPFPLDSFVHCVDRLLGRAGKSAASGAG